MAKNVTFKNSPVKVVGPELKPGDAAPDFTCVGAGLEVINLAKTGKYHAIVCLGCVIRGETDHYDHVVEQTAKGIKDVGVITGIPCIFGVLTCDTLEQAISRAGSKMGNAGRSAMLTGIEMANLMKKVK